jgi:hypothetical protein
VLPAIGQFRTSPKRLLVYALKSRTVRRYPMRESYSFIPVSQEEYFEREHGIYGTKDSDGDRICRGGSGDFRAAAVQMERLARFCRIQRALYRCHGFLAF